VQIDLRLGLGEQLRVRGRGLDSRVQGQLRLTSPSGRLDVHGAIHTVDGSYVAFGQRLVIERGELIFAGQPEAVQLALEATRPNLGTRVGVAVSGTALAPRVRLFSSREMTEAEKLSWLVLGRGGEHRSRNENALLQRAALALLSVDGVAGPDRSLRVQGAGELALRPKEAELREIIMALGRELSDRWQASYEQGVAAGAGSSHLVYRLARRLALRAQPGEDSALDVIWTWRWE
jgi:translocation and assembly module TamB